MSDPEPRPAAGADPVGSRAPFDPAVRSALLSTAWRDRWEDATGGLGATPALALLVAGLVLGGWLLWRSEARDEHDPLGAIPHITGSTAPPEPSPGAGGAAGSSSATVLAAPTAPDTADDAGPIVVHVAGAVARPGVHRLASGARLADLVEAAGGPQPEADLDRVNLAAPVVDGGWVYVPRRGEVVPAAPPVVAASSPPGSGPVGGGAGATGTSGGPVSLSSATPEQLDALPGVGPATAAAIVDHREAVGGFRSVDELLEVRGIGEAKLEALRPLVVP